MGQRDNDRSGDKQNNFSVNQDSGGNPSPDLSPPSPGERIIVRVEGQRAMAAGWVLKGSIVRSEKIRRLYTKGPLDPVRVYCFLRATVDNWGMMPADKWTLKAELGPEDDYHKPEDFAKAVKKLEAVGLVQLWEDQGSPWLYVVGHDEANGRYLKRRTGDPRVKRPKIVQLDDVTNLRADNAQPARTLGTMEREREREREEEKGIDRFEVFWKAYPRRVGKGAARKAWDKIKVTDALLEEILQAVEKQKVSSQWQKEHGQFIPHPSTWLNQERWTDSPEVEIVDDGIPQGSPQNMAFIRRVLNDK